MDTLFGDLSWINVWMQMSPFIRIRDQTNGEGCNPSYLSGLWTSQESPELSLSFLSYHVATSPPSDPTLLDMMISPSFFLHQCSTMLNWRQAYLATALAELRKYIQSNTCRYLHLYRAGFLHTGLKLLSVVSIQTSGFVHTGIRDSFHIQGTQPNSVWCDRQPSNWCFVVLTNSCSVSPLGNSLLTYWLPNRNQPVYWILTYWLPNRNQPVTQIDHSS